MEQTFEHCLEQLKANQLTELNLSSKYLTGAQVIRLTEVLKYNQSLTILNLHHNLLGAEGAEAVSAALKTNLSLTSLNLHYNQLGAAGMESLSEALKVNQTLTSLNLAGNQLGAAGAESLSAALKVNQTLTSLNLGGNQLGAAGAQSLSAALKMNQTLTWVNLYNNQLGAAGAQSLSEALKPNQTLTTLDLGFNQLDNVAEQDIKKALQTNIERIKSTRNHALLTLVILLRQAHLSASSLPFELWQIILQQLDFPSVSQGYRTSHAIASFFTQKNIVAEFNQRLQTQQSVRLIETHGPKISESRFSFLTPQITLSSGAANPLLPANYKATELQFSYLNTKC